MGRRRTGAREGSIASNGPCRTEGQNVLVSAWPARDPFSMKETDMAPKTKPAKPAAKRAAKPARLKDLPAKSAKKVKGGGVILKRKTY